MTNLETAGQILGMGRSKAYEMARYDEFPVPVMRAGRKYTVSVTAILKYLGVE
ncbi:MAG TPA: AlpA family phage regulatory protein [Actinoplanes sp.]|nr:AlpA family phage regulatory protein [Actinoplanes sp.]